MIDNLDHELANYMPGKVMTFAGFGGDTEVDSAVLVEVTENDGVEIEISFDLPKPKRRLYLRVPVAALAAAIKKGKQA